MNKLLHAATITLFATSMAHAQQAVQWRVEDGGNGHWYQSIVAPSGISWEAARDAASSRGGQLASLETDAEASRCFSYFSREAVPSAWTDQFGAVVFGPWIGGYQIPNSNEPAGGWLWISGSAFDPMRLPACCNNACGGSSNEDRLHLYYSLSTAETTWNDLPSIVTCGSQIRGYVVEWSADCNGDGITDYGQILQGTLPDANGNGVPDACDQAQEPQGFLRFERPTDTARIFGNTEFPGVDFTYEMRIRVDPGSPLGRVISEQRDTYEDKSVWISGSTFYGYMTRNQNCGNLNESAVSGIAGAWHHVAWTRDASVARLFVDGQPVATWPSQYVCTGNSPDSLMAIGMIRYAYGCAEQASFRGDLDWIRVSRTCRYSAPFLPPTECDAAADADTLLRLTFNEAPGTTSLVDSGPNHYQCELGAVGCGGPATAPTLIPAVTEPGCRCAADINGDHAVTGADLGLIFVYWGPAASFPGADLNADGAINGADISVLLANWGPCAP